LRSSSAIDCESEACVKNAGSRGPVSNPRKEADGPARESTARGEGSPVKRERATASAAMSGAPESRIPRGSRILGTMSPDEIRRRLEETFAATSHGVLVAYLFGSVSRGTPGPRSDVDIAVLLETAPPPTLEGLPDGLCRELERCVEAEVDLVVLNTASADLVHRVLRDGILLLDRDPSRRIRFEVQKRNEYFDLLPVLRASRRSSETAP
jgi:predicted nucleotidyltransferase